MDADAVLTTQQKALALNLDPATYGAFAAIGGGQEVARWYFAVGAAAPNDRDGQFGHDRRASRDTHGRETSASWRTSLSAQ
jgi:hypothetical protein